MASVKVRVLYGYSCVHCPRQSEFSLKAARDDAYGHHLGIHHRYGYTMETNVCRRCGGCAYDHEAGQPKPHSHDDELRG